MPLLLPRQACVGGGQHHGRQEVGGKAEFGFDKRGMVFRMNIDKLEPSKRVVWSCQGDHPEWNGTVLEPAKPWHCLALHSKRLERDQRFLRDLEFHLGRADVPPQRLCGRQSARAPLERVTRFDETRSLEGGSFIITTSSGELI